MSDIKRGIGITVIGDGCLGGNYSRFRLKLGSYKSTVLGDVEGRLFSEPDVAIYSCSFVKPALFHGDIDSHGDYILAAVVEVIGNIVLEAAVAGVFSADVETIYKKVGITVNAVEFDDDSAAEVGLRDGKLFAIPADAILGEIPSDGFIAVTMAAFAVERHLYRPVVGQVDDSPCAVVKIARRWTVAVTGFCPIGKIGGAVLKIFICIISVA